MSSQDVTKSDLGRERKTLSAMIRIYCRGNHGGVNSLCDECQSLHDYAMLRLDRCPFGAAKPVCSKCHIHCYKPQMREQIQAVMRYSGPKMLLRHPLLALGHLWDRKKDPTASGRKFDNGREDSDNESYDSGHGDVDVSCDAPVSDCSCCSSSLKEGGYATRP